MTIRELRKWLDEQIAQGAVPEYAPVARSRAAAFKQVRELLGHPLKHITVEQTENGWAIDARDESGLTFYMEADELAAKKALLRLALRLERGLDEATIDRLRGLL